MVIHLQTTKQLRILHNMTNSLRLKERDRVISYKNIQIPPLVADFMATLYIMLVRCATEVCIFVCKYIVKPDLVLYSGIYIAERKGCRNFDVSFILIYLHDLC